MGQTGAVVILDWRNEYLGLVLQPSERFAVKYLVPVALKSGPDVALFFRLLPSLASERKRGMGRKKLFLPLLNFFPD
jgi:hypothetical protein